MAGFRVGVDSDINAFLDTYPPSSTHTLDGWIWVRNDSKDTTAGPINQTKASLEGRSVLAELGDFLKIIERDPTIPTRASAQNPRSKKVVREELQEHAKARLRELAVECNLTCGKWLLFAKAQECDALFRTLARSMVDGPLKNTMAHCLKISTPKMDGDPSWVACLYMPDVFDPAAAKEVLLCLVEHHNLLPVSAKPDLYTHIGLYANHPTGLAPVIWRPSSFLSNQEIVQKRGKKFRPEQRQEKKAKLHCNSENPGTEEAKGPSNTGCGFGRNQGTHYSNPIVIDSTDPMDLD